MISFQDSQKIFDQIIDAGDKELVGELIDAAVRYAHIRAEWYQMDRDNRREQDASRTRAHNAFIDACNVLSRATLKAGKDNSWRAIVGTDRNEIGGFACYIHCIVGLKSR